MANLFASAGKINTRFDLKGSIIGRSTPEDQDDTVARKDLDFNQAGLMIALGPEKAKLLIDQIESDSEFFKKIRAVDYSLLVGIHERKRSDRMLEKTKSSRHRWTEADSGGILSADGTQVYYIGIIDILTVYNMKKKLEHHARSILHNKNDIS
jgi:1-phosphatidylinositol-4-phosphate 5-kinase